MLKNIAVTQDLLDYIYNYTHPLHPVQKDILTLSSKKYQI